MKDNVYEKMLNELLNYAWSMDLFNLKKDEFEKFEEWVKYKTTY